ncbi:hypothetical protein ACFLXQ_05405 [Chloroflexota bacterium]
MSGFDQSGTLQTRLAAEPHRYTAEFNQWVNVMGSKKHRKKRRRNTQKKSIKRSTTLDELEVSKEFGIGVIPAMYGNRDGVALANNTYEIAQPSGVVVPVNVSFETHTRISSLLMLLRVIPSGTKLFKDPKSSWPHKWHYLSEPQLEYIEDIGIPVITQNYHLLDSLDIASFPRWLYYGTNIDEFFDSWLEVVWQEYIIEFELQRYASLPDHPKRKDFPTHEGIVDPKRAEAWVALENCAVRIRSVWDCLHKYLVPLYFTGNLPETRDTYWRDLDGKIRVILKTPELDYYSYIYDFIYNDVMGLGGRPAPPLKKLRNNIIHNLSPRPTAPPKSELDATLPKSPEDFHSLIMDEHSRIRELIILLAAIMRAKKPENPESRLEAV